MPLLRDPQPPGPDGADPRSTPPSGVTQTGSSASLTPSPAPGERRKRAPFLGSGKQRTQAADAEALRHAACARLRQRWAMRQAYRNVGGDPGGRGRDFRRWAESQAAAEARARGEGPRTLSGAQPQSQAPPTQAAWPTGGPQPWGYLAPGPWPQAHPAYPFPGPPAAGAPVWGAQAVWGASAPLASYGAPGSGPAASSAVDPNQSPTPPTEGAWGAPPPPPAPPGFGHGSGPTAPTPQQAAQRPGAGPPLGRPCEIELSSEAGGVVIQGTLEQVAGDWVTVRDHFATLHWVVRSQVIEIRLR